MERIWMMEGALRERIKREYGYEGKFDPYVVMASMVYDERSREILAELWQGYMKVAREAGVPFLATTPTRRVNRTNVEKSGYGKEIIADNVHFLQQVRGTSGQEMYVGALMGCVGDAYRATDVLSREEAHEFHSWEAQLYKEAGADFLMAGIMPALEEAVGMAQAMGDTGLPYLMSFMIRRDGKLIDGTWISDAIAEIDSQTKNRPVGYMTNCVHPDVLLEALDHPENRTEAVNTRFRGIQANTSPLSPEELDGAKELFASSPEELAEKMAQLNQAHPMRLYGGCCGTNDSHMRAIMKAVVQE